MTASLKGRNALVTGSTSGIGAAIAEGLAMEGANVMLNGFGAPEAVEAQRARLAERAGVAVGYNPADLGAPGAVADLVADARNFLGSIDILVNNAGIQHVAPIEAFPPEQWDRILAVNLSSAFHTTRLTVAGMKERGWGRIISTASTHGLISSPFKCAYAAAKHGIVGLTKTVALEVAETGITVNAICPGYVLTPLVEQQIPSLAKSRGISEETVKREVMLQSQPTKRFVGVDEVAALAVFLCSAAAASITGSALTIDGGCTAQ
jgi:3-hydroxybutyrate dehydrogenase